MYSTNMNFIIKGDVKVKVNKQSIRFEQHKYNIF